MVGTLRRDGGRRTALAGAVAAVLSLWGVYALVRLSVRVLWVERSAARVVTFDLIRLAAYAAPAGALAASAARQARAGLRTRRDDRRRRVPG